MHIVISLKIINSCASLSHWKSSKVMQGHPIPVHVEEVEGMWLLLKTSIIWKCLFLDFIQNLRSRADFRTVLLPKPSFFSAYWTRENLCGLAGFESDTFLGHIWNKSPYFKLDLWFLFINVVFFIWLPIESILMG